MKSRGGDGLLDLFHEKQIKFCGLEKLAKLS